MYQVGLQFNAIKSEKQEPSMKIKYPGGANPYAYLNHVIDYQIKQAKLEELYKKTKEFCPPGLNGSETICSSGLTSRHRV